MIILFHPRATRPRNCRLPLAVLALAAVLEGREEYSIIDGNLEDDPTGAIINYRSSPGRATRRFLHARTANGRRNGNLA